ncbi:MAG: NAD(P)/FAD-dependent oxidoreductase [Dongiaceae bacterium]
MDSSGLFAPGYKNEPYWWEAAPLPALQPAALPGRAELVIVGSGYTGLSAGIVAQRGGRQTLVIEAERLGQGCSTRNGGQVSTSIKPDYDSLKRKHGTDRAFGIRREGLAALAHIGAFIEAEKIDCDWQVTGRFHAAHNPRQYDAMAKALGSQMQGLEVPCAMVSRAEQRREIGSDFYHGGAVFPKHAALHPGRYHAGLLQRYREAGGQVADRTRVQSIERSGKSFRVHTSHGTVEARDVLVASNGYTGPGTPWQRRRVIPIGSYIIATEPLDPALAKQVSPRNRVLSDSRKLIFYYRLSPDGTRMLFGGRVAYAENDPRVSAPRLHREMVRIFPELAPTRITHSWVGFVAFTFDTLPHLGQQDGVWYCMGYCGSGVSLASYFGTRIGQQILGLAEGRTALDGIDFPTRPLYTGTPWFLAPSIAWYKLRDRLPI